MPVAAHSTLHYLRVYFRVERGPAKSDRSIGEVGYVSTCASCHDHATGAQFTSVCLRCGAKARSLGPMWLGELVEERLRAEAEMNSSDSGWKGAAETLRSLRDSTISLPSVSAWRR